VSARPEVDPYDELPYESIPVEWTAPERMAVTARLHGGPAPPVSRYRYLELGCGDATNLLPLARYRPEAEFIGVDGSRALMALANASQVAVGAENLVLVHGSFEDELSRLAPPFDYVVLHGVFSWIDEPGRDALLAFAARALAPRRPPLCQLQHAPRVDRARYGARFPASADPERRRPGRAGAGGAPGGQ
jgi:SAM-dependent methyltransferase